MEIPSPNENYLKIKQAKLSRRIFQHLLWSNTLKFRFMKAAMKKTLAEWESSTREGEVKTVAIYGNPVKNGEYLIILYHSGVITFESQRRQIDCIESFCTVGQNEASVNPNSDLNKVQIVMQNLTVEYEKKIATAISEFVQQARIPAKRLDDFP